MNGSYAEAGVKCVPTTKSRMKKVGFIAAIILCFVIAPMSAWLLPVAAGAITIMVWMFPRLNYEWEYVFCDGQLDFDKVAGNVKRKRALRIDFENVEVAAPEGSHALDAWKSKEMKVLDFTSYRADVKPFVIIAHKDKELVKILFEPTTKMIDCMRNKAPRKVMTV